MWVFFSFNNGISVWFLRVMLYSALISDLCVSLVGFSLSVDGQWPAGAQRHCIRSLWGRDQIDTHNWLFPLRDKVRWAVFINWCWAMLALGLVEMRVQREEPEGEGHCFLRTLEIVTWNRVLSNFGLVCLIDYVNNEDTERGNTLGTHVSREGVWIINNEPGNCVIKSMHLNSLMRMDILTYFFTLGLNYFVRFMFS